jgi:hypothetical protein
MPRSAIFAALLLTSALVGGTLHAGDDDAIPLGSDDPRHTFERAGCPQEVSKLAHPTNTPHYCGYYVGGGCVCRGGGPGPLQGTFGWDYCGGCLVHPKVMLGWCFKCRYQGGVGAYKTDGPPVPNVFGIHLSDRPSEHSEACCEGKAHP